MKASVHSTKASLKFPRLPVWNVASDLKRLFDARFVSYTDRVTSWPFFNRNGFVMRRHSSENPVSVSLTGKRELGSLVDGGWSSPASPPALAEALLSLSTGPKICTQAEICHRTFLAHIAMRCACVRESMDAARPKVSTPLTKSHPGVSRFEARAVTHLACWVWGFGALWLWCQ